MTEPAGNAGPMVPPGSSTHPLGPWGMWAVRWLGAMLTASLLGIALWQLLEGNVLAVAWTALFVAPIIYVLPIAFVVAVMALIASVLRWALSRFAPRGLQDAIRPVVALGALAAAGPMWLFWFGDDLTGPASPSIADMLGHLAPAGLGGGVASYLAERQVSFRQHRWRVATIGTAVVGALLISVARSAG